MIKVFTDFFPFAKLWYNIVIGMGFLQWLIPAATAGASWLFGRGRGGQPPDPSAPQYNISTEWLKDWQTQSEAAIRGQTTDWLESAMRGYRGAASGRGWTPATTSGYGEFGERASGIASEKMATGLASLYGQIGQYQTQADIAGAGYYNQAYQQWLASKQEAESSWLTGIMGLIGGIPWGGGQGGGQGAGYG